VLIATTAICGLIYPCMTHSSWSFSTGEPLTALNTLTEDSKTEQIKLAISEVASVVGIDKVGYMNLIKCESSFNPKAIGDNGKAYSLLQFHRPTFDRFCEGNYKNPKDQLICGAKMIKKGLSYHWTCKY
jgi:hypothetical protein